MSIPPYGSPRYVEEWAEDMADAIRSSSGRIHADAKKHDAEKVRLDLLPFDALYWVGSVLTYGASKYGDRNWEGGMAWSRMLGAALRHLFAWAGGEGIDYESGQPHLAHAACCVLFLLAYQQRGIGIDDRSRPSADFMEK